jgi:hypothetical protein
MSVAATDTGELRPVGTQRKKLKTSLFEEPLIVEARGARVRPNSEPFSPDAYLFFVSDVDNQCDANPRTLR